MYLSVPFLILHRTATILSMAGVVRCYIFFNLFRLLYSLIDVLLSVFTNVSIRKHAFLLSSLNHCIWSIVLYFSVSLDNKVSENNNSFYYCYQFWLGFFFLGGGNILASFSHQGYMVGWRDSKSLSVSWSLLCILTHPGNSLIKMVSILPLISNSSRPLSNPLGTVPSAPITIGITVTSIFHSILTSLARPKYFFTL